MTPQNSFIDIEGLRERIGRVRERQEARALPRPPDPPVLAPTAAGRPVDAPAVHAAFIASLPGSATAPACGMPADHATPGASGSRGDPDREALERLRTRLLGAFPPAGPAAMPPCGVDPRARRYRLADFLAAHGAAFVVNAHYGILKRPPFPNELSRRLADLRGGTSKVEILGRLRWSPEGRRAGVRIDGLALPLAVRLAGRIPVLGCPLRFVTALAALPRLASQADRMNAAVLGRLDELDRLLAAHERDREIARDALLRIIDILRTAPDPTLIAAIRQDIDTLFGIGDGDAPDDPPPVLDIDGSEIPGRFGRLFPIHGNPRRGGDGGDTVPCCSWQQLSAQADAACSLRTLCLDRMEPLDRRLPFLDLGGRFLPLLRDRGIPAHGPAHGADGTLADALDCVSRLDGPIAGAALCRFVERTPADGLRTLLDRLNPRIASGGAVLLELPNPLANPLANPQAEADGKGRETPGCLQAAFMLEWSGFTVERLLLASPLPPAQRVRQPEANYARYALIGRKA